jgi:TusA-related sulfurtransferase
MKSVHEETRRSDLSCDVGGLSAGGGLLLLVTRMLDRLKPGQVLRVDSGNPSVEHDLTAWARLTANRCLDVKRSDGNTSVWLEKGQAARILTRESADWGLRASSGEEGLDTRALLLGRSAEIPEKADLSRGFSPRGAVVEQGSPEFSFDVLRANEAWSDSASELYEQATRGHWDGTRDIPWAQLTPLEEELERAICQLMTFLAENEFSALYVPAKWIARIHPAFAETVFFLSTQVRDEARHIEVFVKRALANGGGLQFSTASTQASLKSLLDQEDFLQATFLLSVLGEGTFLDLLQYIDTHAPEPVTREIARRTRRDESRHVHFALGHVRAAIGQISGLKERLRRAVLNRASVLSEVKGLNPLVEESLSILAAGGLQPERLPQGMQARDELYHTMHENRIRRLVSVGFTEDEASELSQLHTPNFM